METELSPKPDTILDKIKETIEPDVLESHKIALAFNSGEAFDLFHNDRVGEQAPWLNNYLAYPVFFQQYTIREGGLYYLKTFTYPRDLIEYMLNTIKNPVFVLSDEFRQEMEYHGFNALDSNDPDIFFYDLKKVEGFIKISPSSEEEFQKLIYITNASKDSVVYDGETLVGGITHHGEFVTKEKPKNLIAPSYFIPTKGSKAIMFVERGKIKKIVGDEVLAEKLYDRLSGSNVIVANVKETVKADDDVIVSDYDPFSF